MSSVTASIGNGGRRSSVAAWLAKRPWTSLIVTLLLTIAACVQLFDWRTGSLRLDIDASLDHLIAPNLPATPVDEAVRARFGAPDDTVLVLFQSDNIYSPDSLGRIDALTKSLERLDDVAEVQSLTNVPLPRSGDKLSLRRLQPDEYGDARLIEELRRNIDSDPLLRGQLVALDGLSTAIRVSLTTTTDRETLDSGVADAIVYTAHALQSDGIRISVTGTPIVRDATSRTVTSQLRWTVPAIGLLLTGLLAFAFRSWRGVWLPLVTISVALLWTMATLSAIGRPLNLITSLVPPLLATMGLAYCAHVLTEFEMLLREPQLRYERQKRIVILIKEVSGPVTLTGFTTGVGLLALVTNDLPAIREFALLSTLGVVYTVILVLTFVPAALALSARRMPKKPLPGSVSFERGALAIGRFDMRYRRGILWTATIIGLLAVLFSLRITMGDRFVGAFSKDSSIRIDYERVNEAMHGVTPLSIFIEGAVPGQFLEPKSLQQLDELEAWLREQPEIGSVTGLVDHLRSLNRTLTGDAASALPDTREFTSQLLFFGDTDTLSQFVDTDQSSTLINLRLTVDDTGRIAKVVDRIEEHLSALPRSLSAHTSGQAVLMTQSVERVTAGQLQSIGLALLVIYVCLALQFASPWIGLLASMPTLLQTALYFGALGLFGVKLNATTSLVECLVLGLAVDDTIHYLARFNAAARRTASETTAAVSALSAVLRPITLTKGMLALGFLVLVTGDLENQVLFGWLAAFTLVAAWLVDVFVTPAFISGVRIVTLWDSLRLNLGHNIHQIVPLFAGLSARQAKLFALMSRVEVIPAGVLAIREGDPGDDVYVVIDGKLVAWTWRGGERVAVNTFKRGDVFGEAGYFGQKRTANVETLTRVRVLRFDDADQERICKRYPRLAARIFLNLNRIQAERRGIEGAAAPIA
jgi:predicted RND superfamily exporter protein